MLVNIKYFLYFNCLFFIEMMQESKLNSFQQRQLNSKLKSGQALPTSCHPTTSAKPRKPAQKAPLPKVLNPRNYSGGVKSRDVIEASGAYEKPDYKPRPVGKFFPFFRQISD